MRIEDLYEIYLQTRVVSTDSRNITPGCIFFALKGENFNGNLFAINAIESGATAAIVDEEPVKAHPRIYKVNNVLSTLQMLATFHRQQSGINILAITGSNGKTTTKELCRFILSKKFRVYATQGNLNNHIGVPLTLLAMDQTIQLGIVEMGANHPGEIRGLCSMALPDAGLITNVGKAHLEGFGSIEGVARAKGELFEFLMANDKTIILNEGNEYVRKLVKENYKHVVYYNGSHGIRLLEKSSNPFLKLSVTSNAGKFDVETRLVGQFNAENVMAACCVGMYYNVPLDSIRQSIAEYIPQNNRSQLIETGRNRLFMDAYNANPSSMEAAIDEFLQFRNDNKLLILGEMRELGDTSVQEHAALIENLRKQQVNPVICVGKSFKKAVSGTAFLYFESLEDLNTYLTDNPVKDHFILIKGSRTNRLEKIIPLL